MNRGSFGWYSHGFVGGGGGGVDFGSWPATAALRGRRRCRLLVLLLHPSMTLLAFTSSGIERHGSKGGARRTQRRRGIAADGGGTNAKAAASFMKAGELA